MQDKRFEQFQTDLERRLLANHLRTVVAAVEDAPEKPQAETPGTVDERIYKKMFVLFNEMKAIRPGDRSERDRLYAIAITDMQKLLGFFESWILHEFGD